MAYKSTPQHVSLAHILERASTELTAISFVEGWDVTRPGPKLFAKRKTILGRSSKKDQEGRDMLLTYLDARTPLYDNLDLYSFPIEELRYALLRAASEIVDYLDDPIIQSVERAQELLIDVTAEQLYAERVTDWDGALTDDIDGYDKDKIIRLLRDAKVEITWGEYELFRLHSRISANEPKLGEDVPPDREVIPYEPWPRPYATEAAQFPESSAGHPSGQSSSSSGPLESRARQGTPFPE